MDAQIKALRETKWIVVKSKCWIQNRNQFHGNSSESCIFLQEYHVENFQPTQAAFIGWGEVKQKLLSSYFAELSAKLGRKITI